MTLRCYQGYYKKQQKEISWKNGEPSKLANVWEERSTSNNTKALKKLRNATSTTRLVMATGWEIKDLDSSSRSS